MKVRRHNIIIAVAAALTLFACNKSDKYLTDYPIAMSLTEAGSTKALLDATTFETIDNRIKIYDYYTAGTNATGDYYIDDVIKCSTPGLWPFEGGSHKWTTDGVHTFFGWLIDDATLNNENELFTPTFDRESKSKILIIPETTLGQNTPQFDFMYSDIHKRDLNNNPYFTAVPLEFSHLFTAFKITAANNSSNRIVLKSVTVSGLKNKRSATINYDGEIPVVGYKDIACDGNFAYSLGTNGHTLDPYNSESPADPTPVSDGYRLMWEHQTADFKGDATLPEAKITIVYDYIELDNQGNETMRQEGVSKDVKLEAVGTWLAGNKYDLNLIFKDKEIVLQCFVQDWEPVEEQIDFTEQVYASKPLTWDPETIDMDDIHNGKVLLYSDEDMIAVCRFQIDTPKGSTWTASLIHLEGHPGAFSIVDDTKYGPVGIESTIKIKVNNVDPLSPRHACKLRITVQTADGRTIVVNNLMPADITDESITEYTIIQNLING